MSNFIHGEEPFKQGEKILWKAVKSAFSNREVLGYYKYPLFFNVGEKRKEPDILLIDKKIGLIEIEVSELTLDKIQKKDSIKISEQIAQADDYVYALRGRLDINRVVRGKYKAKGILALPYICKNDFYESGILDNINEKNILFKDDLNDSKLIDKINEIFNLQATMELNDEVYSNMLSIMGYEQNYAESLNMDIPKGTKLDILNNVKQKIYDLDIQQERISKSIAQGPQRIRGIAGSGKTLLICQKAVYMHLKHPDWKIAITFFTQSLYDTIKNNINMYIKAFTNGEMSYDENSNLKILHAWGSAKVNGIYREIAEINNCKFLNASDVKNDLGGFVPPEVSINYISKRLLEEKKGNLIEEFDAIFIDEGQDLVGDEKYKYNNKQSFYYMCYKSIKPIKSDNGKELRRIIWAYDELQSLNNTKIPSSKEIFGDSSLVTGVYKGGIRKSEIMRKCYRTPHQILTSAHAIGMGFFREDGMLTGYTTQKDWENIGYNVVKGDFKKSGNDIVLVRPEENSPNPIRDFYKGECFSFEKYNTEDEAVNRLVECIVYDINIEKLNPSRDILVIILNELDKDKYIKKITSRLNYENINFYIPACSKANILKEDRWQNEKKEKYWEDNAVTISTILRAKGNEAPMVYVIGAEYIAEREEDISYRNKLFTALTRAKCWVKLIGIGDYPLYSEIVQAINANGKFKFKFKRVAKESNDTELEE